MRSVTKLYLTGKLKDQTVIHRQCFYVREGKCASDSYGFFRVIKVK